MATVQKPVRYMGGEFNSVMKNPDEVDVRFAFLFPDTYEVGMSHLGMKILYHAINRRPYAWCERVFSPWVDMADAMRAAGVPLFSLESRTPVSEFDLLGVTLQYEMSFTNVLDALDLAGLPLRAADRKEGPFVIAGGPCAFNPEPLAPFVDLVALGDGEVETIEVVDCYRAWKASGAPREAFLQEAAKIRGIYVPSLYDVGYHPDGTVASVSPRPGSGAPEVVRKAMVADLNSAEYPEKLIVPYGEVVHNRIMLEIFRGCTRGCRFCQAGMIYRPVRERSPEKLMEMAQKLVGATGYDEISLMSLSSGDYSCLPELAREMVERFAARRVRISLPSQRIDNVLTETLRETQKVKKTALTLAPEAGTQRLRDVINKGVTEDDLVRSVTDAFEQGWSAVKLYFMIGLPTETDEDVLAIAELARLVRRCYFSVPKERRAPGLRITVSASVFVPKNFTPFQWEAQLDAETVVRRQKLLRDALREVKGVDFKYHAPDVSFIEAVFARGDRRLADVLERAYRLGCRFDGWSDQFRYDLWLKAFEEIGLDPAFYALRERPVGEVFPWDHLDCGVTKAFLAREREKAARGETTHDCRKGCVGCGVNRYEEATACGR
ncbi:MAG TPA: TIGR03960 family B12-binding radical SAM protein [Candidatus Faecivicinus avistercoris]|nr:TIGR03960 family B12-binding radical SAM protein [Candidatus Faecivicinus avistercoris]